VTIHTIDCDTLEMFAETPERWLDVAWAVDHEPVENRVGRLRVVVANEAGSLGSLSTVIGKSNGNIANLRITSRSEDFYEMMIDVEVRDLRHLTNIITALRAQPSVNAVERARG
jgi:GTP pyrophosphokinase